MAFIFTIIYCHLWSPFWCFSFKWTDVFSFVYHRSFVRNVIMLSIDILYHLWLGTLGPAKLLFSLNHMREFGGSSFENCILFFFMKKNLFWIYVKEGIFNFVLKTSHMFSWLVISWMTSFLFSTYLLASTYKLYMVLA